MQDIIKCTWKLLYLYAVLTAKRDHFLRINHYGIVWNIYSPEPIFLVSKTYAKTYSYVGFRCRIGESITQRFLKNVGFIKLNLINKMKKSDLQKRGCMETLYPRLNSYSCHLCDFKV